MRWVVAYDVEDNRLRTRMAKVLEGTGRRVQGSVFECELTFVEVRALGERLLRLAGDREGVSVRCYRVCEKCLDASFGIGRFEDDRGNESCVIID